MVVELPPSSPQIGDGEEEEEEEDGGPISLPQDYGQEIEIIDVALVDEEGDGLLVDDHQVQPDGDGVPAGEKEEHDIDSDDDDGGGGGSTKPSTPKLDDSGKQVEKEEGRNNEEGEEEHQAELTWDQVLRDSDQELGEFLHLPEDDLDANDHHDGHHYSHGGSRDKDELEVGYD